MSRLPFRLADVPVAAKLMLTALLLLLGAGYLIALGNIYAQHQDADLEPGLTLNDLRRVYHGIETTTTTRTHVPSEMERVVEPGGKMRKYLELGGPADVRALTDWLAASAPEARFTQPDLPKAGDPSPQQVITRCCIECHNADGGDAEDIPYAPNADTPADFTLVDLKAASEDLTGHETITLAPTGTDELIQVSHVHALSMPLFTLVIGVLFLLTGLPHGFKSLVAPLPMIALVADIGSWWLARPFEPAIYIIAAAGAVFGISYGLQILCVFCSLWFGKRTPAA